MACWIFPESFLKSYDLLCKTENWWWPSLHLKVSQALKNLSPFSTWPAPHSTCLHKSLENPPLLERQQAQNQLKPNTNLNNSVNLTSLKLEQESKCGNQRFFVHLWCSGANAHCTALRQILEKDASNGQTADREETCSIFCLFSTKYA